MNAIEIEKIVSRKIYGFGYSAKTFSRAVGIGIHTLPHFQQTKNIRLDTLLMMCDALNLELIVREKQG